jgi:RNA polymerase sigma-70 factor (ECF subfamily)
MSADKQYIEQTLAGDINAFGQLVGKYKNRVFALTLRITNSQPDAEELAQDVFVKAYDSLKNFKGNAQFSTWLFRIAYNTAISYTRKRKIVKTELNENIIANFMGSASSEKEQQLQLLEKALLILNEEDRGIVTLYYMQECSVKDIVRITGLNENSIKVKLFRARKKLQDIMSGENL